MRISSALSERALKIVASEDVDPWLLEVEKSIGGLRWVPLGGIENNVHTVQVAADPALALVERPINSLDAILDLKAQVLSQTAPTPHEAARLWWAIPPGGLSDLREDERRKLADLIRVTNLDSGDIEKPTIVIQDAGTGQHPDDFPKTLLSLLESNKKSLTHQMGVYNAGGAASYAFCTHAFVISRKAPQLLGGKPDEAGITVVRYNPLDPDRFKSGTYEYCVAKDGTILRAEFDGLPDVHTGLPSERHGTYIKLISYELSRYHRAAFGPKQSLWHLFHAAIPDPCLPFRIIETRKGRFSGMKGETERRVVTGLLHLLQRHGTCEYHEEREITLGPESGKVILRYFVINDGTDPDGYTTNEQGLTFMLNGQRHGTKDRVWLKRNTDLHYIYKRLVVLVDGNGLTNATKRAVFASTRESHKESPEARRILERVVQELRDDEDLRGLDEAAQQRTMAEATRSTSDRVKKQLASQVAALLKGMGAGGQGGKPTTRRPAPKRPPKPPTTDDTAMLEIPDALTILSDPLVIETGGRAGLRLHINAKNGFIPKHAGALSVVLGPEIKDHIKVASTGRLLGGRVTIRLEASDTSPIGRSSVRVALVDPVLPVFLTAAGEVNVIKPAKAEEGKDSKSGGEPDVEILWHDRADWEKLGWDEQTAGFCDVTRDEKDRTTVTKVVWHLNRAFAPYESVISAKKVTEATQKALQEAYEYPVCWAMFQQAIAAHQRGQQADEDGSQAGVPEDYVKGELARVARAVLMAKEPELAVEQTVESNASS